MAEDDVVFFRGIISEHREEFIVQDENVNVVECENVLELFCRGVRVDHKDVEAQHVAAREREYGGPPVAG